MKTTDVGKYNGNVDELIGGIIPHKNFKGVFPLIFSIQLL